jgi:hypothetical protein
MNGLGPACPMYHEATFLGEGDALRFDWFFKIAVLPHDADHNLNPLFSSITTRG